MNELIKKIHSDFLEQAVKSEADQWQAIPVKYPMWEQENVFIKDFRVTNPVIDFEPDYEWCQVHFKERVGGLPLNPGESYKIWPYYKGLDNDQLFRESGKFSHTYMERFWPKYTGAVKVSTMSRCGPPEEFILYPDIIKMGIRHPFGDLDDLIKRLKDQPFTRQAFFSIWHPEDQSNNNVRLPCTIGYWFKRKGEELNVTYLIRSCDLVRHFRNDLYLTHLLQDWLAGKLDLQPGTISVWIGSLHCFESDFYHIKKIIR